MSGESRGVALAGPLEDFLLDKSSGDTGDSGNYRRGLERAVTGFISWYEANHDHDPTFADLDPVLFRQFARDLRRGDPYLVDVDRLRGDTPVRGTVITYYQNVSAYLGWAVDEGYLDENPAQADQATDPLPEDDGRRSGDEQFWTDAHRQQITTHVDQHVQDVLDDTSQGEGFSDRERWQLLQAVRDRALVYCLAYSGIRVGELLRDHNDDRREGVTWGDLSLEDSRLTVLSKRSQETWSDRSLPDPTIRPLERLQTTLAPPSDDWPIFPSLHRTTLYAPLRDAMRAAGVDDATIDERLGVDGTDYVLDLLREFDVRPPSMSAEGARSRMKTLTEAAGIDVDDRHGYLTPHGGRRGIGEVVVRQYGFSAAARFLDDTEEMVRRRYSHIEAGELASLVSDAIDAHEQSAALADTTEE
jgi:integrase